MGTTTSSGESTEALNGKLNFEQSKNRIVGRDADNLIRLLILADGANFVMKVAKEGFDATNASDDELIFNSDQNVLKVVDSGSAVVAAGGAGTIRTTTIDHDLGFVPAVIAYQNDGTSYFQLPYTAINITGGTVNVHMSYVVTATQITFYVHNSSVSPGTSALTVKYYLLQESAS